MLSRPMSPLPSMNLVPLRALFDSSPDIDRQGFTRFAKPLLVRNHAIFHESTARSFASRQRRKPGGSIVNSGNLVRFGTVGIFGSLQVTGGQGAGA
jgi:hypothetical protein